MVSYRDFVAGVSLSAELYMYLSNEQDVTKKGTKAFNYSPNPRGIRLLSARC